MVIGAAAGLLPALRAARLSPTQHYGPYEPPTSRWLHNQCSFRDDQAGATNANSLPADRNGNPAGPPECVTLLDDDRGFIANPPSGGELRGQRSGRGSSRGVFG